jgi:hypothetical protein
VKLNNKIVEFIKELINFQEDRKQELLEYVFESDTISLQEIMNFRRDIKDTYKLVELLDKFTNEKHID